MRRKTSTSPSSVLRVALTSNRRPAAENGVHVLCEKPLEITTDRVDEMIVACEEAGVRLGGIFQNRYLPPERAVHEAAAAGRLATSPS